MKAVDDIWRWWAATIGLAVCFLAFWFSPSLLHLQGINAAVTRGAIGVVGISGIAAFVWNQTRRKPKQPPSEGAAAQDAAPAGGYLHRQVADALRLARKRMQALTGRGAALQRFPTLILAGEKNAGKTFLLKHSQLSLEWLVGQDLKPAEASPTPAVNVQLAGELLIVDPGHAVMANEKVWRALCRLLSRPGLKSLLGFQRVASRGILVCVNCDLLTRGPESVSAAAASLREPLEQFALQAGARVPVYVVFTKTDKLKHFNDFFQHLEFKASNAMLGSPLGKEAQSGSDERAYRDLLAVSFSKLVNRLREKRIEYLQKETALDSVRSAYEFPREFRKLRTAAVDFLAGLCPSIPLARKPFLRGFFFAGTRLYTPSVDGETSYPGNPAASQALASGATQVFQAAGATQIFARGEATQFSAGNLGSSRAQQMFVAEMFRDIIVPDLTVRHAATTNTNLALYRRIAATIALALLVWWGIAFARSHSLNAESITEVKNLMAPPSPGQGIMSLQALHRKIDDLEAAAQASFFDDRHWGLFAGDALLPAARKAYFNRFRNELLDPLRDMLAGKLSNLPRDSSLDNWQITYQRLKTYLVITSLNTKSSSDLAPFAANVVAGARNWDPQERLAATGEFQYYLQALKSNAQLLASGAQPELVTRAQDYLNTFSATQQLYGLAAASANNVPPLKFRDEAIATRTDVPGLFTKEGKDVFTAALGKSSQSMRGEAWVLGPRHQLGSGSYDDATAMYDEKASGQWKDFLTGASVREFGRDARIAAARLENLSDTNRALFRFLCFVSKNTSGDTFAPVAQACDGPDVAQPRQFYINALIDLQVKVSRFAETKDGTPDRNTASEGCIAAADGLRQQAGTFANLLKKTDPAVNEQLRSMLLAPAKYVEPVCKIKPGAGLNAAAQRFCQHFQLVSSKFPFSPDSPDAVTAADLSAIFDPQSGELANLKSEISKNPAGVELTHEFRYFYNAMQQLGTALYSGQPAPSLSFSIRPLTTPDWAKGYILSIQGQRVGENSGMVTVRVPDPAAESTQLRRSTQEAITASYSGPWGGLRLLEHASMRQTSPSGYRAGFVSHTHEGEPSGSPIVFELVTPPGSPPFLDRNYFASLKPCVGRAAE